MKISNKTSPQQGGILCVLISSNFPKRRICALNFWLGLLENHPVGADVLPFDCVCVSLCLASPDWSKHCSLNYQEQGVWGVLTALVSCSPWVLIVFCMAFYHTAWTSVILLLQLHQVCVSGVPPPSGLPVSPMVATKAAPPNPFTLSAGQGCTSAVGIRNLH